MLEKTQIPSSLHIQIERYFDSILKNKDSAIIAIWNIADNYNKHTYDIASFVTL